MNNSCHLAKSQPRKVQIQRYTDTFLIWKMWVKYCWAASLQEESFWRDLAFTHEWIWTWGVHIVYGRSNVRIVHLLSRSVFVLFTLCAHEKSVHQEAMMCSYLTQSLSIFTCFICTYYPGQNKKALYYTRCIIHSTKHTKIVKR